MGLSANSTYFWMQGFFGFPFGIAKTNKAERNWAKWENDLMFQDIFVYLSNLCINMTKWNLPKSCNERALKETLYFEGRALFFYDLYNSMGMMHTPVILDDGLNHYYEHTKYKAVSWGYNESYTPENAVLIRANPYMYPLAWTIGIYAERIMQAARTIDVFASTLKRPWVFYTDDESQLEAKVIVNEIEKNEIMLLVDKNATLPQQFRDKGEQNRTDPKGLEILWKHKDNLMNEVMTRIGINNNNSEKKERQIMDEVNANNQLVMLSIDTMIDTQKKACDAINKMFGDKLSEPVSIELNHDYLREFMKGGEENGQVYNNSRRDDN